MSAPICPHCGFNLANDEILVLGDWRIDPRGAVTHAGDVVKFTPAMAEIFYTIARAGGRSLTAPIIAERLDTSAEDPDGLVRVLISRIRTILREAALPVPFRTAWRRGYAWGAA